MWRANVLAVFTGMEEKPAASLLPLLQHLFHTISRSPSPPQLTISTTFSLSSPSLSLLSLLALWDGLWPLSPQRPRSHVEEATSLGGGDAGGEKVPDLPHEERDRLAPLHLAEQRSSCYASEPGGLTGHPRLVPLKCWWMAHGFDSTGGVQVVCVCLCARVGMCVCMVVHVRMCVYGRSKVGLCKHADHAGKKAGIRRAYSAV